MRSLKKILVVFLVLIFSLVLMKDVIIKSTITIVGSAVIGAPLKVKKFSLGLFTQKISIKGLQLMNPKGFGKEPLIDINEITLELDLQALFKKSFHIPLILVDLNQMTIVKDKNGDLNIDALKLAQKKEEKEKKSKQEKESKKQLEMIPFHIELLRINIGEVVVKDFSQGESPVVKVYDLGFKNKEFKDIRSIEQFTGIIMMTAMGPTALQGAKIYGAMTVLGTGFLPVGAAAILISDDDVNKTLKSSFDKAYDISLAIVQKAGRLKKENKRKGVIKAKISGCDVTIEVKKKSKKEVDIKVSARKLIIPKPKIAAGVLYQIEQELK